MTADASSSQENSLSSTGVPNWQFDQEPGAWWTVWNRRRDGWIVTDDANGHLNWQWLMTHFKHELNAMNWTWMHPCAPNELNLNAFMCTFAGHQKWAFQQGEESIAGVPQTCVLSGLTQASFTLICVVILLSNLNKDGIKWINRAVITVIISHLGLGMHSSSDCFLNTI